MGRGANTPSFPIPCAPNPNYLHTTTYGSRAVCNPTKPGTPPKTPPQGTIAPGSIQSVDPFSENHARFGGIGGAQYEPSLVSRGMPRSFMGRERASKNCEGWAMNNTTGRGFAQLKGTLPKDDMLRKEEHLGELVAAYTKEAGKPTWQVDPDNFYKLAQLADVPIRAKAIARHKRKNPTHSRQQIRFHPLLERNAYEKLLRPGTNSTGFSSMHLPSRPVSTLPHEKPDIEILPPRSATTEPINPFGRTGSLRSSPSQVIRTARTMSSLGSANRSRLSNMTDNTQFSRLSVASAENRKLREENERLQEELHGLKLGGSTGRSGMSLGTRLSRGSRLSRASGLPRTGAKGRKVTDPALAQLADKLSQKIYQKWSKCSDAFRSFDTDKSGAISAQEMEEALKRLGVATQAELAGGKLTALCRLCDQNDDGKINYEEFANKLKGLDTNMVLIEEHANEAGGLNHHQRMIQLKDAGIMSH